MPGVPRLRMFAGPNGSGKSTLKALLRPELLGAYVNPDDIEREIRGSGGFLKLRTFGVEASDDEFRAFVSKSTLLEAAGLLGEAAALRAGGDRLDFSGVRVNSYYASVAADFVRHKLIEACASFTFETVMSSVDKVELLCKAQARGYRTYLYFVATDDPAINVARVRRRVADGGHDVPEDKIRSRYDRALANLSAAVRCTNRAYVFDNSGQAIQWLAEVTEGKAVAVKQPFLPHWFDAALPTTG